MLQGSACSLNCPYKLFQEMNKKRKVLANFFNRLIGNAENEEELTQMHEQVDQVETDQPDAMIKVSQQKKQNLRSKRKGKRSSPVNFKKNDSKPQANKLKISKQEKDNADDEHKKLVEDLALIINLEYAKFMKSRQIKPLQLNSKQQDHQSDRLRGKGQSQKIASAKKLKARSMHTSNLNPHQTHKNLEKRNATVVLKNRQKTTYEDELNSKTFSQTLEPQGIRQQATDRKNQSPKQKVKTKQSEQIKLPILNGTNKKTKVQYSSPKKNDILDQIREKMEEKKDFSPFYQPVCLKKPFHRHEEQQHQLQSLKIDESILSRCIMNCYPVKKN